MVTHDPRQVVLDFICRINSGDVDAIVDATTSDHEFIDSAGSSVRGREAMRRAWAAYLRLLPDYRVDVDRSIVRGDEAIVLGRSSGTLSPEGQVELAGPGGVLPSEEELQGPAIWSGRVRGRQDGMRRTSTGATVPITAADVLACDRQDWRPARPACDAARAG